MIPSHDNVNLQLGWETDKITVVLFAENALDSDDFTYINPDVFSFNRYATLRPRTVGLRANWRL